MALHEQERDYDAIIIGTGMGGLSTGAYLAKNGARVLLCEQHSRPGGCFTSFKYKGYTFDGGIQGCENYGILKPMLYELDILDRILLVKCKFGFYIWDYFHKFETEEDIQSLSDFLIDRFPDSARFLKFFKTYIPMSWWTQGEIYKLFNMVYMKKWDALLMAMGWFVRNSIHAYKLILFVYLMRIPAEEFFTKYVKDPEFYKLCYAGAGANGIPMGVFLPFFYGLIDYHYPAKGGVQAIPDLLAECILENGGEIRYNTKVKRILVKEKQAVGVELENSETIQAPFIVNNGDARRAFLEMMPEETVPKAFRQRLSQTPLTASIFMVHLGVDMDAREINTKGFQHICFLPEGPVMNFSDMHSNPEYYRYAGMLISVPTLLDKSLAPPGKSIIVLYSFATIEYRNYWGTDNGRPTPEYEKLKNETADQLITSAERVFPGLSQKIEVKRIATPFTFQRYLMTSEGAVMGWTYHPRETFNAKRKGFKLGQTPINNLYQVGQWALSPGSAAYACISGKLVSNDISKKLRKMQSKNGTRQLSA